MHATDHLPGRKLAQPVQPRRRTCCGAFDGHLAIKLAFLTPFIVSTLGSSSTGDTVRVASSSDPAGASPVAGTARGQAGRQKTTPESLPGASVVVRPGMDQPGRRYRYCCSLPDEGGCPWF